jgi:hypothetical protein
MPQHRIYRASRNEYQSKIARAREVLAECLEVLRQSRPDTFLGRQHHEPIEFNSWDSQDPRDPDLSSRDRD